jgi:hypothetical protein
VQLKVQNSTYSHGIAQGIAYIKCKKTTWAENFVVVTVAQSRGTTQHVNVAAMFFCGAAAIVALTFCDCQGDKGSTEGHSNRARNKLSQLYKLSTTYEKITYLMATYT